MEFSGAKKNDQISFVPSCLLRFLKEFYFRQFEMVYCSGYFCTGWNCFSTMASGCRKNDKSL
jgi:hypothetical protein